MDKEKIIIKLITHIDTVKAHVNRLKKSNYNIHPLDVDMLRQKTTELYALVFELEQFIDKNKGHKESHIVDISVVESRGQNIDVNIEEPVENLIDDNPHNEIVETEIAIEPQISESDETSPPAEPAIHHTSEKNERETLTVEVEEKQTKLHQSTYDLFSVNTDHHIAEKYHSKEEPNIGDKMQKSQVLNIREAIGINEKFLFINELFNGDLGRYNSILDDINGLTTKQGVDTYLFELKIQLQWSDDNDAYLRLKEILDRKFSA
ncbi:MAG: hypothetical protein H8E34_00590 [Bacteroidetes bacterium]|nr:hypothetical protein [Bacteroidota bacterium]MBL6944105.1 hypothetical protein [Bacteroidales bacterium]